MVGQIAVVIQTANQYIFVPAVVQTPVIGAMNARHIKVGLRIYKISAMVDTAIGCDPSVVADDPEILVVNV